MMASVSRVIRDVGDAYQCLPAEPETESNLLQFNGFLIVADTLEALALLDACCAAACVCVCVR